MPVILLSVLLYFSKGEGLSEGEMDWLGFFLGLFLGEEML